jgi:hypothetical protein
MVNASDLHNLALDSVYGDVWQAGKKQCASALDPTGAPAAGKFLERAAAVVNGLCYTASCGGIVFLNML